MNTTETENRSDEEIAESLLSRYPNLATLTERKEKDRLTMARILVEVCHAVAPRSVRAEIIMDPGGDRKRVEVRVFGPGSLQVRVGFDGASPHPAPNTFVLSWYMDDRGRPGCGSIAVGFADVQSDFRQPKKATDVCHGFAYLLVTMYRRLAWMESGKAVVPATDPAKSKD
jgi:hypothetical protein